jgi:hypothetical protein
MRITSDGNVGVGTSSPTAKLNVVTGSNQLILDPNWSGSGNTYVAANGTGSMLVGTNSVSQLTLFTNGVGRMTINAAGAIDTAGNPISSCPTTAKAFVNFNGAPVASDYTTGNAMTYSIGSSTTTVTITRSSHSLTVGDWIYVTAIITGLTGATFTGTFQVTATTATSFQYVVNGVASGSNFSASSVIVRFSRINGTPYNVSSIVKTAGGDYTINFANALASSNYNVAFGAVSTTATSVTVLPAIKGTIAGGPANGAKTTSSLNIITATVSALTDSSDVSVTIFAS